MKRRAVAAGLALLPLTALAARLKPRVRVECSWEEKDGSRKLVVPPNVAEGWELSYDHQVSTVLSVSADSIRVQNAGGGTDEIPIVKKGKAAGK